jgi:molybdate transport system substrate-binding protein
MLKYLSILFLAMALPVAAFCQPLRIAVAANAQFVAGKLQEAFQKETGVATTLTVSSSGKLTAQIEQGAPFGVFLSADMKYPEELFRRGLTTGAPKIYAYGTLVLWTLKNIDLSKGLQVTLLPDVKTIAIGNPKTAPYGEATIQALDKQRLLQQVTSKLVYGESIAQVNQYLLSGAADLAFTAQSVVMDPAMQNKGKWVAVDEKWYNPIAQGVVMIKSNNAAVTKAAQQFYQFLFSPAAKAIFTAYGYK